MRRSGRQKDERAAVESAASKRAARQVHTLFHAYLLLLTVIIVLTSSSPFLKSRSEAIILPILTQQIELMKKKLAAARKRIENGDGAKEGEEQEEVKLRIEQYMLYNSYFTAYHFDRFPDTLKCDNLCLQSSIQVKNKIFVCESLTLLLQMQEQDVADIKTYKSVEDYPRDVLPTQVIQPATTHLM